MRITDASSYKEYLVVLIHLVLECDYLMVYSEQKGLCAQTDCRKKKRRNTMHMLSYGKV